MAKGSYERELKGILEGDPLTLERVTKSCSMEESENYLQIKRAPFFVVRAAGSYGIDLIAVRGEVSMAIEVKARAESRIPLSRSHLMEQWREQMAVCERANLCPIYAYRLKGRKGDAWRLFTFDLEFNLSGIQALIYRFIAKAHMTERGNPVLVWEDGTEINRFIAYITALLSGQ